MFNDHSHLIKTQRPPYCLAPEAEVGVLPES